MNENFFSAGYNFTHLSIREKIKAMKKLLLVVGTSVCLVAMGCKTGMGCKGNGRNVGAERILSEDKQTKKELKRAGKFRS